VQVLSSQWAGIAVVFLLILVDTLIAYVQAVRTRTWSWSKVGQFVQTSVLQKIGGLIVAAVMANGSPSLAQLTQPAWWAATVAVVAQTVLGDIAGKVHGLEAGPANKG
jgi:Kef-type K+ transport system membrane component KefB